MSLVSGVVDTQEDATDQEKGTREKRYRDGSLEVWYTNGNRSAVDHLKTSY